MMSNTLTPDPYFCGLPQQDVLQGGWREEEERTLK